MVDISKTMMVSKEEIEAAMPELIATAIEAIRGPEVREFVLLLRNDEGGSKCLVGSSTGGCAVMMARAIQRVAELSPEFLLQLIDCQARLNIEAQQAPTDRSKLN